MKKKIFLILPLFFLISSSCSKDDSNHENQTENNSSSFTINTNQYTTSNGYISRQTNDGTGYKTLIILTNGMVLSDPFDADTLNANSFSSNTTNIITFTINSTSLTELAIGTYILNTSSNIASGNLYWATIITGITINNSLIDTFVYESYTSNSSTNPIISGNIIISKNGNTFTITYSLSQNNITINGNYIGSLTELGYTE